MSKILSVYVDDETEQRLETAATDLGRKVEELAENAVAEAALDYWKRHSPRSAAPGDVGCKL